jgi:DNA-binding transcriptional MerR regulator
VAQDLTIEELAAASGMTVRNIRAHQARGLVAPPEVRMRVGYYGPEHIAALRLIRELQDDGFNLAAIKQLLSDAERTEERFTRFRASLTPPADAEQPQTFTAARRRDRLGLDGADAARVLEHTQEQIDAIAAAFVRLFVADVWRRFEDDGMPVERRPEVDEAIDRLRRVAAAAVAAAFARSLNQRIEEAFAADRDRADQATVDG